MWKQIFKTGLWAGTLDILAAFIQAYLTNGTSPGIIMRYIASGVFGKNAFTGGYVMMLWGLLFHFIIAFGCTVAFFLLYPRLKFLHRGILMNSFLIAIVAWTVTTQVIVPLSRIGRSDFNIVQVAIAVGILVVCIGLPIAFSAKQYYLKKS